MTRIAGLHDLHDLSATEWLARRIAAHLRPADAILLDGPLGAGKTSLARAMIRAMAQDPTLEVPSPTYTLVQTYETPRLTVHHFDLWRLDQEADLSELGWDAAREDVVIVEWPDRLGRHLPDRALTISLSYGVEAESRHARLSGWDDRW